jgi:hypothetical protein
MANGVMTTNKYLTIHSIPVTHFSNTVKHTPDLEQSWWLFTLQYVFGSGNWKRWFTIGGGGGGGGGALS